MAARSRHVLVLPILVACGVTEELRFFPGPMSGASRIVLAGAPPVLATAQDRAAPLLLVGLDPPIDLYVLDYEAPLFELGLEPGPLPPTSCRSCELGTPSAVLHTRLEVEPSSPAAWDELPALPEVLLRHLIPDRAERCLCPPLSQREVPIPGRDLVVFAAAVDESAHLVLQQSGELLRVDDADAALICTTSVATSAALRGTEELWTSGFDGIVRVLDLARSASGGPCVVTSSVATPGGAHFRRLAVTGPVEAPELVGVTGANAVLHWFQGRWQLIADLRGEDRPQHARWAGGRRFYAGSDVLFEVDEGRAVEVGVPFRNPAGFSESVVAIDLAPDGELIAAIDNVGIVAGLGGIDPRTLFGTPIRLVGLVRQPDILYFVGQDRGIGRVAGGELCDPEPLLRGFAGRIHAPLGARGLLVADTGDASMFDELWVLRVEPAPASCAP